MILGNGGDETTREKGHSRRGNGLQKKEKKGWGGVGLLIGSKKKGGWEWGKNQKHARCRAHERSRRGKSNWELGWKAAKTRPKP